MMKVTCILLAMLLTGVMSDPKMELDLTSGIIPGDGSNVATIYGGFVVAWVSGRDIHVKQYIYLQGYHTNGTRMGEEMMICKVQATTTIPQISGGKDSNRFMVAFAFDDDIYRVDGLLFDFGIELLSPPCPTGTDYGGREITYKMRLASTPDASFFALASSRFDGLDTSGIFLRIYNSEEIFDEPEPIHVSTLLFAAQTNPDVAILDDLSIIITWQDIHGTGVYSIRYSRDGYPLSHASKMNNVTALVISDPTVARLSTGYAIAWKEKTAFGLPVVVGGLVHHTKSMVRIYSNSGVQIGDAFQVDANEASSGNVPTMVSCEDDTLWVAYSAEGRVHAKHFDLSGKRIQQEVTIHGHVSLNYQFNRVGLSSLGSTGLVITFGTGQRMPIATYWWSGTFYGNIYDPVDDQGPMYHLQQNFSRTFEPAPLQPWTPPIL